MAKAACHLIGYGAIGRALHHRSLEAGAAFGVASVLVRGTGAAPAEGAPLRVTSVDHLPATARLVVECAGQAAVVAHGEAVLRRGFDLMPASVGALVDDDLLDRLRRAAAESGSRLLIPAGAVGGIDCIKAHAVAGLTRVRYRSRKAPANWTGTPAERHVDLASLAEPAVVFAGSAREAATAFPKNANVAATIALAGLGPDRTEVELVADPGATETVHEVEGESRIGRFSFRFSSVTLEDNPKTSAATVYSLIAGILEHGTTASRR